MLTYQCKKTGQSVDVDESALPVASIQYIVRKGFREYFDNYHASETLKKHGGDAAKVAEAVTPLVDEAYARLMAGDVPGERAPTDPKVIAARKLAADLMAQGITAEDLAEFVKSKAKKSKAA